MAGRSLPWWLAGTSIVATTFAADTPLAIAGLVATGGIAANWFWWADVLPVMMGALLVSHLWRRSEVLTDNEIVELRYGGRGWRSRLRQTRPRRLRLRPSPAPRNRTPSRSRRRALWRRFRPRR